MPKWIFSSLYAKMKTSLLKTTQLFINIII